MKLYLFILSLLVSVLCNAQKPADMSDRLDFDNTGTYKLLQMSNGNTLLFHFFAPAQVAVTVFSKAHNLLRTREYSCKYLNLGSQSPPLYRGLYEINGDAILFAERTTETNHSLLRLRFDAKNGNCLSEVVATPPDTNSVGTSFHILKNRNSSDYNVFCFKDVMNSPSGGNCELLRYNAQHVLLTSIPFVLNTGNMKSIRLLSADIDDNGSVYVVIGMNGAIQKIDSAGIKRKFYDRKLVLAKIKGTENRFIATMATLAKGAFPHYNEGYPFIADFYCDTATAKFSYLLLDTRFPENLYFYPLLLTVNDTSMHLHMKPIGDGVVVREKNAKRSYYGIPMKLFVRGDTSFVVSENFLEHKLGEIRITSLDSDANILQTARIRRNLNTHNVYPDDVLCNRETKTSFQNSYADYYNTNCITANGYTYVFYNENPKFGILRPSKNKYSENINTYELRCGSDRSARRMYPFGKPSFNEYFTALMGSTDFDQATNCYATLVHETSWYKNFYRVAWCMLK